jgi:endonuclease YncB( thermonuclease family)
MLKRTLAGLAALLASSPAALALTIAGNATVTDSDHFDVGEYHVYLFGVESVEQGQMCGINGQAWDCWAAATRALQTLAEAGPVTCEAVSGPDFVNQAIAVCRVNGEDVGATFVRQGFGIPIDAETNAYDDEEAAAEADKIGLWQSSFYLPAEWRQMTHILVDRPFFHPTGPLPDLSAATPAP